MLESASQGHFIVFEAFDFTVTHVGGSHHPQGLYYMLFWLENVVFAVKSFTGYWAMSMLEVVLYYVILCILM